MQFRNVEDLTKQINQALDGFCEEFQYTRKNLLGLGRAAGRNKLFKFDNPERNWAINEGGGTEIQYHLYFDEDTIGYGLGFNTKYVPYATKKSTIEDMKPYSNSFLSQPRLLSRLRQQGFDFLQGDIKKLRQLEDDNYVLIGKEIDVRQVGRQFEMLDKDFDRMIDDLKGILFDTYTAVMSKVNKRNAFASKLRYSIEEFEELFKTFLQRTIPRSASNYLSAVPTINRIGKRLGLITDSLYELQEMDSYIDFYDELAKDPEYIEKNTTGHNMYRSSLNKYREFIEETTLNTSATTNIKNNMSLNQILYGPPGTGKTYATTTKALDILNIDYTNLSREEIKQHLINLQSNKRIFFTTFHQNMAYEDFIEGIKPIEPDENDMYLKYEVQEGLFMKACIEATYNYIIKNFPDENQGNQLLTYNQLYDQLFDEVERENIQRLDTRNGDQVIVTVTDQGNFSIQHIGGNRTYTVSRERLAPLFEAFPDPEAITNMNNEFRNIIGGCNSTAYWSVLNKLRELAEQHEAPVEVNMNDLPFADKKSIVNSFWKTSNYSQIRNDRSDPYVFIIDEINRGNVAQIFGELITLIEDDKRLGKSEMIKVDLPYSKNKFCVPPNLYLIGTMNTADRSVEALDTALRRRFVFEEVLPDYELEELQYSFAGTTAAQLLQTVNRRIEKLIGKDNVIGHAYFLLKENEINIEDKLVNSFYKCVIPLLQEYFFGDFGKIGLVLGKGFVTRKHWDIETDSFADFEHDNSSDFDEREVFEIIDYRKADLNYNLPENPQIVMTFEKAIQLLMKQPLA